MTTGVRTRGMLSLARGVNAELRELQDERIAAQQGRQAFQTGLTCLSHDIRTPLAGAQGYLQLVDGEEDPAEKARFLSAAAHRLGDVRALLDDLFSFAQVHDPSFEVVCELMKPADVVGDVLMGLYPQFRERGWELSVNLDDEALALADAEALARIVRNLVANALRHGAAAPVVVQRGARISVENRVANPDALDVDRLFERFASQGGSVGGMVWGWPSSPSWPPPWTPPRRPSSKATASASRWRCGSDASRLSARFRGMARANRGGDARLPARRCDSSPKEASTHKNHRCEAISGTGRADGLVFAVVDPKFACVSPGRKIPRCMRMRRKASQR